MSYLLDDTICAIATAPGGAARGMVRVSGPSAVVVLSRLFETANGPPLDEVRQPTAIAGHARIELDVLRDLPNRPPVVRDVERDILRLPCDVFLWPGLRSYTRQPTAEVHTIGSPPLLEALLAAVCRAGARLAQPGEFTLRAFLAGRLDLTQAEGVLGVIDARGEDELRAALAQLAGGIARPLQQTREDLLQILAELEAGLDFVEEDIEFVSADEARRRIEAASRALAEISEQMTSRSISDRLPQVALLGESNVGKSSLFNALVARRGVVNDDDSRPPSSPALVSPWRGTTRDYLTSTLDLDGLLCELVDTAGVDQVLSKCPGLATPLHIGENKAIDSVARAMAAESQARAAVRALCTEARQDALTAPINDSCYDVIVLTKADLAPPEALRDESFSNRLPAALTSSLTGQGLDELCTTLRRLLTNESPSQPGQVVSATADRCRESIRLASAALGGALEIVDAEGGDELLAAELRTTLSEIGKVVGAVYTDDLLDRIFSSFCIGK